MYVAELSRYPVRTGPPDGWRAMAYWVQRRGV